MLNLTGYNNLKIIHEGHRNIVYSAWRKKDHKQVIIKVLRSIKPEIGEIALIYHEFEVTKDLALPGVIKTYDLIEEQNQFALVQEDIQGISVSDYVKQQPIKDLSIFYKIALQMVASIGEIHRNHIIHKDIKPGNFIIDPKGLINRLTDFNIAAKLYHEVQEIVPPGKLEGTLAYMAPEQTGRMNMNIDYRSDFYALGVTFYELLTGQLPFQYTDPLELLHAHLAQPPPDASEVNPSIPKSLGKLIQKLMAKDPSNRYQSAIGIQIDLERCYKGENEPFILGLEDVYDRLNLSQKLYGREAEARLLLDSYDRVSQGGVETLMVCGYSGIGKTMLINEVHKPMVKHKGYFISGKFDQLERKTPYTAITQAFNKLARLILSEPDARFEGLKKELIKAMGSVAQLIIDLAPDMELILGPQPPLEKLPPQEMQNRMMIFFKRFLQTIASKDHPLVLFIDDLQWIDSGSLKLLEYIITDEDLSYVLLIGAFRDNEVDMHHPLRHFFKGMQDQGKMIHTLQLGPLTPANYEAFFKDSFIRDDETIKPFANLIHKRTEGNPFFCKQVISSLYKEHLVHFDHDHRQWEWNIEGIRALKITDNVVDLMLGKVAELPKETQKLLKYASCVGNRFTIEMLKLITDQSADSIGQSLWSALQEELIVTMEFGYKQVDALCQKSLADLLSKDITYQFIHDRVQQAVYQSISQDEKQSTHLTIARVLVEKEPEACKKERLFEVTDHFNQAQKLLTKKERIDVINLNYQAGLKALGANAYQPMSNYLQAGLVLTEATDWNELYELMFKLNREYAQSLYLTGAMEESAALADDLLHRAQNALDKASIYRIQYLFYQSRGKMIQALGSALNALEILGLKIPKQPSIFDVWAMMIQIKFAMWQFKWETLDKELKAMTDKNFLEASDILKEIPHLSYWVPGNMYLYLSLVGMDLILRHGRPPSSGLFLTRYSMAMLDLTRNVEQSLAIWAVAERFIACEKDKNSSAISYQLYGFFYNHLRNPFKEAYTYYQRGIRDSMDAGNLFGALANMHSISTTIRTESKSLNDLKDSVEKTLNFARKINFKFVIPYLELFLSAINNEMDLTSIDDSLHNAYENVLNQKILYSQTVASVVMARHYYFSESYVNASECHFRWFLAEEKVRYDVNGFTQKTIGALSIVKCLSQLPFLKRLHYRRHFRKLQQDVKWAAKECPPNYLHQYLILCGALSALKGREREAIRFFEEAIENAKKGDFYLWIAIANELAGDLLIEQGLPHAATYYIREAHYYYSRYGMGLKVKILEKRYPENLVSREELTARMQISDNRSISSSTTTSAALDFMSVIKASQTISREINLEKLFEKMLHIASENAGAEKAVFLEMHENGSWFIVASLSQSFQLHNIPLQLFDDIPEAIINLALRTNEPIVITDTRKDDRFSEDEYVRRIQPKSVLCVPIVHHETMVGLLYLENNLSIGSFTHDRVTVLKTLASQMAISLVNSHYLDHVQRLYNKTECFVPRSFLEILNIKKIEDVLLGACVKKNISVLFNDIRSFTTLVEKRTPEEAFAFVNRYWTFIAPIIRKHHGYIDQFLGDGLLAIFPNKPEDAIQASMAMMDALAEFNAAQKDKNDDPIKVGVGISTGLAMLGVIGEKGRHVAGIISDVANTAARVEGLNKMYGSRILLSGGTMRALTSRIPYILRKIDHVFLKGKITPTEIYEVIEWTSKLKEMGIDEYLALFSQGFHKYSLGQIQEALADFKKCLVYYPEDKAVEVLIDRCQTFLADGVPEGWNGTFVMTSK